MNYNDLNEDQKVAVNYFLGLNNGHCLGEVEKWAKVLLREIEKHEKNPDEHPIDFTYLEHAALSIISALGKTKRVDTLCHA